MSDETAKLLERLRELNAIGVALSSEKDSPRLLERILQAARTLACADGGTLYSVTDEGLKFEIMFTESLGIHKGGTSKEPIPFPPLPLYDEGGNPNLHMVAVCAALEGETINIPDAYTDTRFEFSGTRAFDEKMNYRSQSFLTVPMKDHENELIGVLQLINATDPDTGDIHPFAGWEQELVESLASQAAVALVNQRFIEEQKALFESFIQLIAGAIDDKSPYTGGHCSRVPVVAMLLADAVAKTTEGPEEIRNFTLTEEGRYELWVSAMLHDCGKITTMEYVVDKGTKLETIFDRIHLVEARFEILRRDAEIALLRRELAAARNGETGESEAFRSELDAIHASLQEELEFLRRCNTGGEFMAEELKERVRAIGQKTWTDAQGNAHPLLLNDEEVESRFYPLKSGEVRKEDDILQQEGEVENLCIPKGTLRDLERHHINYHITASIKMLEALPYPRHLTNVPEFAGGHHERMDGKGYPKGLTRDQMSIQARLMGIADIFEALTAADRPYKKAMPLSTACTILRKMRDDNHIDPDLYEVFIRERVYEAYAKDYLRPDQIDEVDAEALLA
ncbi:MAG: HD domain-containing phosphohydrolase [Planctomycetota bacterium]|jgi:HD-GYP domain-containing protein (c-di-GMP phosphodiesterase class II)